MYHKRIIDEKYLAAFDFYLYGFISAAYFLGSLLRILISSPLEVIGRSYVGIHSH